MLKQELPSIEKLMEAGAHFGHLKEKWHPKMQPYIFTLKNNVHIIDLEKTLVALEKVRDYLAKSITEGKTILFVGTKKQIREQIENTAKIMGMPYINYRWLGGTLTNFETVQKALKKYEKQEKQSQDKEYLDNLTKKEQKDFMVNLNKLRKSLGGLKTLTKLPDILFVVDTVTEKVAVDEAIKLNIPVVAIIDSNSDPSKITYPIPANDDSKKAVVLILEVIAQAPKKEKPVKLAKKEIKPVKKETKKKK